MEVTTISQVLLAAAARIERDGWCQGGCGRDGDRRCMMAALGDEHDLALPTAPSWLTLYRALERHIRPGSKLLSVWNDQPDRTVDEVLAALRGAAAEVEAGR